MTGRPEFNLFRSQIPAFLLPSCRQITSHFWTKHRTSAIQCYEDRCSSIDTQGRLVLRSNLNCITHPSQSTQTHWLPCARNWYLWQHLTLLWEWKEKSGEENITTSWYDFFFKSKINHLCFQLCLVSVQKKTFSFRFHPSIEPMINLHHKQACSAVKCFQSYTSH